ncbi:unnamed protein product [Cyclocybe aegerita]|uniref:FAD-binding PCMH-type domain-containing protein n=1 Tax=Cyclocybe aegerita TaxID=1973307 RepID=A0A8S0WJA1_CYCAE|nr:unnamed protein product [Cyclocybe aegerita]
MKNILLGLKLFLLSATAVTATRPTRASRACRLIESALPGKVFYPGTEIYAADMSHFQSSAEQNSTCSVNPDSTADLSTIIRIIGRDDIRSPFAVKSGGHATNQGFSSTTGVLISMASFTSVVYDQDAGTASFGTGRSWDEIYTILEQYNVTVAGGRVPGVGVGLILGGGFSWIADQYGLGVDNVVSFDLVMPNGTFVTVSDTSYPEVLFGLKGGLNNFGIVSSVTMYARPIGAVWGGVINYAPSALVSQAVADFSLHNTDHKAQLAAAYVQTGSGQAIWQIIFFYDGGFVPPVYQPFLDIPALESNVGVRAFSDLLATINVVATNSGGFSNVVPIVQYTLPIIDEIQRQINITYQEAVDDNRSVIAVLLGVEPFLGAFNYETRSAYPHSPDRQVTPCNPWITFSDNADADYFHALLRKMSDAIQAFAVAQGQSRWDDIHYPNYALADTPLNLLYGSNVPQLKRLRRAVDPKNIMGLTGGYKF